MGLDNIIRGISVFDSKCYFFLLGWDVKRKKVGWVINSVAKYSFGMYLISWLIDIVVYKMIKVLLPQYNPILLLTIKAICGYTLPEN